MIKNATTQILLLVLLTSLPARADWTSVAKGKSTEIYVDWETLNFDGRVANISYLVEFEKSKESKWGQYNSVGSLSHFDCVSERYFEEISILFPDKRGVGEAIRVSRFDVPKDGTGWKDVATSPITEITWIEVCTRVGAIK
jgi:hypothetical protein